MSIVRLAVAIKTAGRSSLLFSGSLKKLLYISNDLGIAAIGISYQVVMNDFYLRPQRVALLLEIILKNGDLLLWKSHPLILGQAEIIFPKCLFYCLA